MSRKLLEDASLKAVVQTDQHTIEFYLLAFSDTPDKQGDRIARDAADVWLKNFYAAGVPLPISFAHAAVMETTDPNNIIGYAPADRQHVFKDAHGIRVVAFLDTETNPVAQQVYSLTKRGIIRGASVAYITSLDGQKTQRDGSTLITKIDDIIEGGPCLDPANEDAYVIAVKAMTEGAGVIHHTQLNPIVYATKVGKVLSRMSKDKLSIAYEVIGELLSIDDKTSDPITDEANEEEPQANSEEPDPDADIRAALALSEQTLAS